MTTSLPAKVGGDEREALTADEVSFVLDVYRYPGAKLSWETTVGVWSRPEALDLVTCVGSYKWNPTSKLDAIIRAALSADGGEDKQRLSFLIAEGAMLRHTADGEYWCVGRYQENDSDLVWLDLGPLRDSPREAIDAAIAANQAKEDA